jgi:hypothetical protein
MGIQHIEESKELRKAFDILGREGIAKRAIDICKRVAESENYKDSVKACGEMHALFISCKADHYWEEKAGIGYREELWIMKDIVREGK